MLFQAEHIAQIRDGTKTVTRRDWKRKQVREGGTYIASTEMFTSHDAADCYIRVVDVDRAPLGEMTERDAHLEGGYSLDEFRELWVDLHGEWDSDQEVYVVTFEYAGRGRPRSSEPLKNDND